MDLVTGAKGVVVAVQHAAMGKSKIVKKCNPPLTLARTIDLVVTDMAVIGFPGGRATLMETAPGLSVADVSISNRLGFMPVPVPVPVLPLAMPAVPLNS
jgi:acetate CoA/acetoacetate CoA-transferase beta subunit